jgi:hypothetical protein
MIRMYLSGKVHRQLIALLLFVACAAEAQPGEKKPEEKKPYYLSLNAADVKTVCSINGETLGLQYYDAYGTLKEIPLRILDASRKTVATLSLDKVFGLNTYSFNLLSVYPGWKMNYTYTAQLVDEKGKKYELLFRLVPPPTAPDFEVSIMVDPQELKCDALSDNLVKFYGVISGGSPPYTVDWYVLNNARTDFLYQPQEQVIGAAGKTPVITVDKDPEYYVALYVKDNCGHLQEAIVQLACDDERKKINTIFVEQIPDPTRSLPIIH